MVSNIEVRFARDEDSNAIKEAERKIIKVLGNKGRRNWYLGDISQLLESEDGQCIVVTKNKKILGVIGLDKKDEQKIQELFPNYKLGTGLRVASMIVLPSEYRREVSHALIEFAKGYAEENDKNCFFGAIHPEDRAVKMSLALHLINIGMTEEMFSVKLDGGRISRCRYFWGRCAE